MGRRRAELPGAVAGARDETLAAGRHTHLGLVADADVYRRYRDRLAGTAAPTA